MENKLKDTKILLLGESESAVQTERRVLREAGYTNIQFASSGIDAARLLAESEDVPEIAVCGHKLQDMEGEQFCAIIRQHPLLLGFPILLILPNATEAEQLKTLGCGASSLLGRPYSVTEFNKCLDSLRTLIPQQRMLKEAAKDIDTSAFDIALSTYGVLLKPDRNPEDYFRVGMRCLEERNWNLAINAFEHALRHAQIKAEAELGMAAAFKGKGDMGQCKAWLSKASSTFVEARRWHHARAAYGKLLKHDPEAKNPFITQAHKLIRQGSYNEAAQVLAQGLEVTSLKEVGDRYAQLCFVADDPQAMLEALEKGFGNEKWITFLGREIRQNLEILAREREERNRELAKEREWQLAKNINSRDNRQDAPAATSQPGSNKPFIPVELAEEKPALLFGEESENGEVLEALAEKDGELDPMDREHLEEKEDTSSLGDFLSVVKLTWKLARRK